MGLSTSKKSYSYPSHQITRIQIIILTHVHIPLSLSTSPLSRVHHFGKKGGDPCRAGWLLGFGEKTEFLHSPPVGTPAVR
jgi:hypothetical protein